MSPASHTNPLLQTEGLPQFTAISPEHVVPAVREILEQSAALLARIEADVEPTWESIYGRLQEIDNLFEKTWEPVSHLLSVNNSEKLREAHEAVLGEIVQFSLKIAQSEPIYQAMKQLRESDAFEKLASAQQRTIEAGLRDVELAGIGLRGEQRERFNEIARELSQLSTDFSNHVLDATKAFSLILSDPADVEGFPESLRSLTSQSFNQSKDEEVPESTPEAGPWKITLDFPCYVPFMEHCQKSNLRETVYRAFVTRASEGELDNTPLIDKILKLRQEKAKLLGFDTYAELSLESKMASTVEEIEKMEEQLRVASWKPAEEDLSEIRQLATNSGESADLKHWDIAYWAERLREQKFEYTDEQLRPYFPLPRVLDGLFGVIERLFDVSIKESDQDVSVWDPSVRYYEVSDASGTQVAAFFLDPYSRPKNKRGGAWMDTCLNRQFTTDRTQLPVAHLVCNGTPPVGDKPSLMTFSEVVTLFHEFGHGLHHMLTKVDYPQASGINNVEWDAVELPSQFMENWCYHRPTLLGMTAHYETGEPLPVELFEKICQARTYRAGSSMLRQLQFGLTDLELHHRYVPDSGESVFELMNRISEKTSVMPLLPESRSLCAFQHIFAGGYAAGYYSYKWAEVLSADAFSAFEEAGLDNDQEVAATGRRFRDEILAVGGSRHPMESFKAFRGREPSIDPLLRHNNLIEA